MIKLLAFDLDGTILLDHTTIPEKNMSALKKAHEKGIIIVPTTGRIKSFIPKFITDIEFIKYAVTSNGGGVYNIRTDECIYESLIDADKALEVLNVIEEHDLFTEYYVNGEAYAYNIDVDSAIIKHQMPEKKRLFISKDYRRFDDTREFLNQKKYQFQKINLSFVPENIRTYIKKEVDKLGGLCVTTSLGDNWEINHMNATKGEGVRALCEYLGITKDEVMTIGDNDNDLSMIKWATHSVAMGNGIDEVKSAAKYITDNCEDCGFATAVEKYALQD